MSEFGSSMGAAMLGAASDAVIVSLRRPLASVNALTWPVRLTVRSVRIEVIRGSIAHRVRPVVSVHALRADLAAST